MKALFSKPWVLTLLGFALIGGLLFAYTTCSGPAPAGKLTKREVKGVSTRIDSNQAQAGLDTTRAKSAAASAATSYQAGKAYADLGTILHQQTKPHAKNPPVVAGDSAAARLQKLLSTY